MSNRLQSNLQQPELVAIHTVQVMRIASAHSSFYNIGLGHTASIAEGLALAKLSEDTSVKGCSGHIISRICSTMFMIVYDMDIYLSFFA